MCIFIQKIYDQITLIPNLICCIGSILYIVYNSIRFFSFLLFFLYNTKYEIRNRKQQFQMDINYEIGFLNNRVSCEPFIFVLLAIYFAILMRRFHCFYFLLAYISNGSINENPNNIFSPHTYGHIV